MGRLRLCQGCREWYESKMAQCPYCDYIRNMRVATIPFGFYGGSPWAAGFKRDQLDFSEKSMGDSMEEMRQEGGVN